MLSLLSLTSAKEWFWAGLVIAMGLLALHIYHAGENHEIAAMQAQSAKLVAQAQAQVAATQANYQSQITTLQEKSNAQQKIAAAQSGADAQLVRNYDAYRRAHPDVGSPAGAAGASSPGADGADGTDTILNRLEQVALELTAAARDAGNALGACVSERNTLTGK